jgi:hypothetical protein
MVGNGDSILTDESTTAFASSERDRAHSVTSWMLANFRPQLTDAVRSTPFSVPLLCACAYREAGRGVGNRRERQVLRTGRWNEVLRGNRLPLGGLTPQIAIQVVSSSVIHLSPQADLNLNKA